MKTPFHLIILKAFHAQRNQVRPYMAELGLSPGQPKILGFLTLRDRCMQKELAGAGGPPGRMHIHHQRRQTSTEKNAVSL